MEPDGPSENPIRVPPRNQNRLLTYIAPAFVVLGVAATISYSYLTYHERQEQLRADEAKRDARARIFLEAELPKEGCIVSRAGARKGCALDVRPKNNAMHIFSFSVQFPADYYGGSHQDLDGNFNGAAIDLKRNMHYLVVRGSSFIAGAKDASRIAIPLPLIIYSAYEFEGEEYTDRSLYCVRYVIVPKFNDQVIPISLIYVGRLSRIVPRIDFLIDPWSETVFGFSAAPSYALTFGCPGQYGFLTHVRGGRLQSISDLSPGHPNAPRGHGYSFSASPETFRFRSFEPHKVMIDYSFVDIGGLNFRGFPLPVH